MTWFKFQIKKSQKVANRQNLKQDCQDWNQDTQEAALTKHHQTWDNKSTPAIYPWSDHHQKVWLAMIKSSISKETQ